MDLELIQELFNILAAVLGFLYTIRFVKAAKKQDVVDMIRSGFFAIIMTIIVGN